MKKLITFFILLIFATNSYCQIKQIQSLSSVKDDSYNVSNQETLYNNFYPTINNPYAPSGTVPFPINYCDYVTNGNNMRRLAKLGDTIIVAVDLNPDRSGPPPPPTTSRVYYQVSYDGGLTWLTDAINTSYQMANRWPNIFPVFISGSRTVTFMGREYYNNSSSTQRGATFVETILGLGNVFSYLTSTTYWRDYFGGYKNSTLLGGIITSPANGGTGNDVLWYMDFNYNTCVYGSPYQIANNLDVNFRYNCDIASNGMNICAVRWKATNTLTPQAYYVHESTNGGSIWQTPIIVGNTNLVNGDSCVAWVSFDIIYKPGTTQKCFAFATISPANEPTREGSKILYWSPIVNGGNPVVICDYHKVWFNDTTLWNHNRNNIQIGMAPLSHPSLAFSDDGTRLYCAFSAIQRDTTNYKSGMNYHFNNILICTSVNNGATWSSPYFITTTARRDETYPSLSKKGNNGNYVGIVYSESGSPGSYSFNDNTPPDSVYTVYKKVLVLTGVNNNNNEIPSKCSLMQNFPNPFNPVTVIRYELPQNGFVKLTVYDILGKEVETLVSEKQNEGIYEVKFDGSMLSNGIYFYRLQTDNFTETKKMILIK